MLLTCRSLRCRAWTTAHAGLQDRAGNRSRNSRSRPLSALVPRWPPGAGNRFRAGQGLSAHRWHAGKFGTESAHLQPLQAQPSFFRTASAHASLATQPPSKSLATQTALLHSASAHYMSATPSGQTNTTHSTPSLCLCSISVSNKCGAMRAQGLCVKPVQGM